MTFQLDSRLQNDTFVIGQGEGCQLLLMNDKRYPWFIVVPTVTNVSEWFDLPDADQSRLHLASVKLAQCIRDAFDCEKINIGALGNIVRQMHIHVVGRFVTDPAWPGPVWGHSAAVHYTEDERRMRCQRLFEQQNLPFKPMDGVLHP